MKKYVLLFIIEKIEMYKNLKNAIKLVRFFHKKINDC